MDVALDWLIVMLIGFGACAALCALDTAVKAVKRELWRQEMRRRCGR